MTTLAISAPQPDAGTITCAALTRISSVLAGAMIWVKSTAAKLVAAHWQLRRASACWHGAPNPGRFSNRRNIGTPSQTGSLFCPP
jgi:hypothetical protein